MRRLNQTNQLGVDIWDAKTNGVLLPKRGDGISTGHQDGGLHTDVARTAVRDRLERIQQIYPRSEWRAQATSVLNDIRTEMMNAKFKPNGH